MSLLAGQVHCLSATTPKKEMQKEECRMKKSGLIASALQFSAPPQARRVLETQLRRLALDANCFFILHSAF